MEASLEATGALPVEAGLVAVARGARSEVQVGEVGPWVAMVVVRVAVAMEGVGWVAVEVWVALAEMAAVGWAVGRAVMADAKGAGSRAEVTVVAATAVATAVARFAYTLAPALRGARPQTSPASLSLEAEQTPGPGRDPTLQYQQKPTEEQLFIMTNEEWNQAIYGTGIIGIHIRVMAMHAVQYLYYVM